MPPRRPRASTDDLPAPSLGGNSGSVYVGTIGSMPCYVCKLRGEGITDSDSNWRLWNADMKVFRDGVGKEEENEVFASLDDEILARLERRRKAILWFSISEQLRERLLSDMGGRDKTSGDVFKRIYDNCAPKDAPYEPLEVLTVTDELRKDLRRVRAARKAMKSLKK